MTHAHPSHTHKHAQASRHLFWGEEEDSSVGTVGHSQTLRHTHIFSGKNRLLLAHTLNLDNLSSYTDIIRHVHKRPLYLHLFLCHSVCLTHTHTSYNTHTSAIMATATQIVQKLRNTCEKIVWIKVKAFRRPERWNAEKIGRVAKIMRQISALMNRRLTKTPGNYRKKHESQEARLEHIWQQQLQSPAGSEISCSCVQTSSGWAGAVKQRGDRFCIHS